MLMTLLLALQTAPTGPIDDRDPALLPSTPVAECRQSEADEVVVCARPDSHRLPTLANRWKEKPITPRARVGGGEVNAEAVQRKDGPAAMVNLKIPF